MESMNRSLVLFISVRLDMVIAGGAFAADSLKLE